MSHGHHVVDIDALAHTGLIFTVHGPEDRENGRGLVTQLDGS